MVVVVDGSEPTVSKLPTVQSGTPLSSFVSPRCRELILEFRTFGRETFESLITLGKTVVAAKVELKPKEYNYFCTQVGFKPDSPTLRKFECLGRNAARLERFGDRMPNRWTTLYLMSTLTPEQLELLANHDEFGPDITAQMVRKIVMPKKPAVEPKIEPYDSATPLDPEDMESISIITIRLWAHERKRLFEEIEELQKRFPFRFTWTTADGRVGRREPPVEAPRLTADE